MNQAPLAFATVLAVAAHQLSGKGLRPVAQWDDRDVTDSTMLFAALTDVDLRPSDKNERKLDSYVSPIVFGAFYQDGEHPRLQAVESFLTSEGFYLAELRWNHVEQSALCYLARSEITVPVGYWPFVKGFPVSLDAFDDKVRETIQCVQQTLSQQDAASRQQIAGYFVTRQIDYPSYELTVTEVATVLEQYALRIIEPYGQGFHELASDLMDEIDAERVEIAALRAGFQPDRQSLNAQAEIKEILIEIGVLEF